MSTPLILKAERDSSAWYSNTLTDPRTGDPLKGSMITSITARLTNARDGAVINGRDGTTNLLGGEIAVNESGALAWELTPADNAALSESDPEPHFCTLTITWPTARAHVHVFIIEVSNPLPLRQVDAAPAES